MNWMRWTLALVLVLGGVAHAAPYKYIRLGNPKDVQTSTSFSVALMGGGSDLDEAFRWLCKKGNGGDFLVLRAHRDDDYNPYVNGLCKANSVATLIIPDHEAAMDPAVADIIRHAEVIFIAGGISLSPKSHIGSARALGRFIVRQHYGVSEQTHSDGGGFWPVIDPRYTCFTGTFSFRLSLGFAGAQQFLHNAESFRLWQMLG